MSVNQEKFSLRYVGQGRGGTIFFESNETSFDMWYELAMPPAIIIIGIPESAYWEVRTKLPLSRRQDLLRSIGRRIVEEKLSGNGYSLMNDNIMEICKGEYHAPSEINPELSKPKTGYFQYPNNEAMKRSLALYILFAGSLTKAYPQKETPQRSLNLYVEFLNRSIDELTSRFEMIQAYQAEVTQYRKKAGFPLRLSSSGPIQEFYYQKALSGQGLTSLEIKQLNGNANTIWRLLSQIDQTGKSLETYVRLKSYESDNLKQSDEKVAEMQSLFKQFSGEKETFYQQIQRTYTKYQPYLPSNPYLKMEREMVKIIKNQQQLLETLPYYLNEGGHFEWPTDVVQKSMLEDEKLIAEFGQGDLKITYPASSTLASFKSALQSLQAIKQDALDDHNFEAQKSAKHGNSVYLALINHFNNDLLASHKSFISYSKSTVQMLDYVAFSPIFAQEQSVSDDTKTTTTNLFKDKPLLTFNAKRTTSPATEEMIETLNDYVDFINESLRQMHLMQVLIRNYESSSEYHRIPSAQKRAALTYSHQDFKVPMSAYQLLMSASSSIDQDYRPSITSQAEVLISILKEMDELSIELISYTAEKKYLNDQLHRSDEILDRYAILFDIFDQKKEQLYNDLRRIHESYPNANPTSSWSVSGDALLTVMDDDRETLFDVKALLKSEVTQISKTNKIETNARKLIADEYQNMKGLQRYGRSNGLCPYSPYEDLAENSIRFAEKAQKLNAASVASSNQYESFYYFYNNELVYQYNKFVELAKTGLLKAINQPDVFAFRRLTGVKLNNSQPVKPVPVDEVVAISSQKPSEEMYEKGSLARQENEPTTALPEKITQYKHDTVFVERVRVDTVFINQGAVQQSISRSLDGFATNNMVLLLDVSASMESPFKLPLLKRSIKSMLTLLRTEDQISIVLYSGKARVVLKPTSGAKATEIARMIDLLKSDGDTDGNEGLRLAYKVANKQYIRAGNNRIVLATDGEFPISDEVLQMIGENARQDVHLSVFTFGRNQHTGQKLKKLSQLGGGTYAHVTEESADLQLILEAQAKKQQAK